MTTKTLHLSAVDQNTVRVYTQTLQVFPFPDGNQVEAAIQALTDGLRTTLTKFPFLAGILRPADPESGRLSLTYPTEITDVQMASLFVSKILDSEKFPYSYDQLKGEGMPPSVFTGKKFCPEDFRTFSGIPKHGEGIVDFGKSDAPVMRVQVFFIPDGLVLSICVHHAVMDCSGIDNFWKHFARGVSERGRGQTRSFERVPNQSELRSLLDARIHDVVSNQLITADSYINGEYHYARTLPPRTECSQRVFVIPAARIRAFRDELRQSIETKLDRPPLTVFTVLATLIWIHVTRARSARLIAHGYAKTSMGIATDLRRRLEPALSQEYMGNMALFTKATTDIATFVAEDRITHQTIIPTIKRINSTIYKANNDWVMRHLQFYKSIDPITDTECALKLNFGPDLYVTSWMNFGAQHQWKIPGTTPIPGSNPQLYAPEFIRRIYNPSDGGMMILPRRSIEIDGVQAPYEVMVRLATEDMDRLINEEGGLAKWADRIID